MIAAGHVGERLALVTGIALIAAALGLGFVLRLEFVVVLLVYIVITASYTLWLKHEPVLDIVAIASGFIVRAVAGGGAVPLPRSRWVLIVTPFRPALPASGQ